MKIFVLDQLYPTRDPSQKPAHWSYSFTYKKIPKRDQAGSAPSSTPGLKLSKISVQEKGQAAALGSSSLWDLVSWESEEFSSLVGESFELWGFAVWRVFWMTLLLDTCQGRKRAELPWLGEALESLSKKREREEGEKGRMATAFPSVLPVTVSN